MKVTQQFKQKPHTGILNAGILAKAVMVGAVVVFVVMLVFNTMGVFEDGVAGENPLKNRYSFDLSDENLKKVNFTVLDREINTVFAEVRPLVAASGNTLFFSRRNFPQNVYGATDRQDIWVSSLGDDGRWSMPANLGKTINSKLADALCGVSPDGKEIILFNEQLDPGHLLFRSRSTDKGWSEPSPMTIEDFYNQHPYVDFFFSFPANVLLMAVARNDSKGEQDLYVSFPKGKNTWSKPQSLGATVNTGKSDFAPFLAADGRTLYFASYGHKGFGGCDIFMTTRLDDTWKNWSEPKNLGKGINSKREESYFSISGDYEHIYFESYDLEKQVRDIFRADLPAAIKPATKSEITAIHSYRDKAGE